MLVLVDEMLDNNLWLKKAREYNQQNICFIYDRGYVFKQFITLYRGFMVNFLFHLPYSMLSWDMGVAESR